MFSTHHLTRLCCLFLCIGFALCASAEERPHILWISSEDNGPQLGCYGDEYATTPNLDALAARGFRYTRASSNAPVCAPARTTIITGLYPPSSGGEHMRSMVPLPEGFKMFPAYLAEAGYHTTNPGKKDYNRPETPGTWADVPKRKFKRTWQAREEGQPFFAVYNFTISHESKIRNNIEPENQIHDPAEAPLPAYHPDTPEVRGDWAQYYDRLTMMDAECGAVLADLEADGLADDTIIFYWGDHGSGMPRSKRWPYNSGLHVPLIAYFPEKWRHLAPEGYRAGGASDRLVSFVDLAPTMLSIAGIEPKDWMQGHAFAGEYSAEAPEFSYGFRGRMDERVDLVRTVMDQRYVYLRQYMPHRIYGQYIQYMFQTPTTRVWEEMFRAGKLNEAQSHFWREKPTEELYDLRTDPSEVVNLAGSPDHREVLEKMRQAHLEWAREIRDVGFLPEDEIHSRSEGSTPYEMGHDPEKYDFEAVFAAARLASDRSVQDPGEILPLLKSGDSAVRYWGAQGLLIRGEEGVAAGRDQLLDLLNDESGSVAAVAGEALGRFGGEEDARQAVDRLVELADQNRNSVFVAILANNALDFVGERAAHRMADIRKLPRKPASPLPRTSGYVGNLLDSVITD